MGGSPLERTLDSYLAALAEREECRPALERVRSEFLRGTATLVRFGYATRDEMFWGDTGLELLHETCAHLLGGCLGSRPEEGEVLRLLGRLAHAQLRRPVRRWDRGASELLDTLPAAVAEPRASFGTTARQRLLAGAVTDPRHQKKSGGVHLGRLAVTLATPPKSLRIELRELGRELGRDAEAEGFWLARLGECAVELLRREIEGEIPDLLPTAARGDPGHRLHRLLSRLKYTRTPPATRRALGLMRDMARRREYPIDRLFAAARDLVADELPIVLAQCEWLRSRGDVDGALEALDTATTKAAGRGTLVAPARRRALLDLARARCLEQRGDVAAASDTLEPQARLHRRDPLLAYDRLVLAEAAGHIQRMREAARDLRALRHGPRRGSALLWARIERHLRAH